MPLPRPRPTVVIKDVSEGAILFCTETETYFSLNLIGVRIWRLLPPVCTTEGELLARLGGEYPDIAAQTIRSDVRLLLTDLLQNKLVEAMQPA